MSGRRGRGRETGPSHEIAGALPFPPAALLRYCACAALGLAWAVGATLAHAAGGTLGFDDARHFLNRAGFAASPGDIEVYSKLTREAAADRLLASAGAPSSTVTVTAAPSWVDEPYVSPRRYRAMAQEERQLALRAMRERTFELQSWWLGEMLATGSPLAEKMTLFWHNHFVSSQQKVRSPQLMYRQHLIFRRHALGSFAEMLHAVARDPAMVIYLDSASNRKGRPNENFARELMELFTLGEGRYAESDIKEVARAFTGWSIDPDSGEFLFREAVHDGGVKTVLGRTGALGGDAVLDLLLEERQTAEFVVGKLWREFVSPVPEATEVARLAGVFRDSRYDIKSVLKAMLVSDAFYAPRNRATLVKSPVELVVGTLRQFEFRTGEVTPFVITANQLGQVLFLPPNVKGWPGGVAWINSTRLLARKAFLERIFRVEELRPMLAAAAMGGVRDVDQPAGAMRVIGGRERYAQAMMDVHFDSKRWLTRFEGDRDAMQRVLLAASPAGVHGQDAQGLDLVRQLTQDPVYQLK